MIGTDATDLLSAERFLRFGGLAAGPEFDTVTLWVESAEISDGGDGEADGSGSALIDSLIGIPKEIETGPGCLRYCIVFRDCVTYAWRDESFAMPEEDDDHASPLRRHERSAFLDYVGRATTAQDSLEAPVLHFSVYTLDAVLDVACPEPPEVSAEMIGPDDPGPKPGPARRR